MKMVRNSPLNERGRGEYDPLIIVVSEGGPGPSGPPAASFPPSTPGGPSQTRRHTEMDTHLEIDSRVEIDRIERNYWVDLID